MTTTTTATQTIPVVQDLELHCSKCDMKLNVMVTPGFVGRFTVEHKSVGCGKAWGVVDCREFMGKYSQLHISEVNVLEGGRQHRGHVHGLQHDLQASYPKTKGVQLQPSG